jgi:signal transduction histidine kinase
MANTPPPNGIHLNLAIVGGGRTCRFFLSLFNLETSSYIKFNIVGVCDINPDAEGYQMARQLGIYTTTDYREFFTIPQLDAIIELTNRRDVLLELVRLRPRRIGILEHNIGRFLRNLLSVDQKLKAAEQQIILEQTLSDFLIQQVRQKIVVLNTDFTIAEVNTPYLEWVKKARSDVVGAHCYRIIHGLNAPCNGQNAGFACPMVETIKTGKSSRVIQPDPVVGDPFLHEIVTYPVCEADGRVVRVIEIWRDISPDISSRWKKRENELKSNLNMLIQEDRLISLGKLVASCVHEINNPIQGLLTFSHLMMKTLKRGRVNAEERLELLRFCELMSTELERCGDIVSGLLSFARESRMEFRSISLNEVLDAVIQLTRHRMELQKIDLQMDLPPASVSIHGDSHQMQQCFLNLVFNAIEAMPSGGRLEMRLRADTGAGRACVEIGDTGNGISEEHLGHIFDPFFTTKPMGEGTGLGLSIVYGVVKSHGGRISVNSSAGQGTRFVLYFPLNT